MEHQPDLPGGLGSTPRFYYVDESGDPVLFDAKGKIIVGKGGCSRYFFMGLLSVFNPPSLEREFAALHQALLTNPKFGSIPSFQPGSGKTFYGFHAKDDLPEVRRMVFELLVKNASNFKFFAVVKDKIRALSYVLQQQQAYPCYRYDENDLYDHLVYRLFATRVTKNRRHDVYFARRGPADRTAALRRALVNIQTRFGQPVKDERAMGIIKVMPPANPFGCINLQAVDYCLWALQRFYARGDEEYLRMLWPSVSMIHEMDSETGKKRGETYAKKKHPFGVLSATGNIGPD